MHETYLASTFPNHSGTLFAFEPDLSVRERIGMFLNVNLIFLANFSF
jgi:hypothetical protein